MCSVKPPFFCVSKHMCMPILWSFFFLNVVPWNIIQNCEYMLYSIYFTCYLNQEWILLSVLTILSRQRAQNSFHIYSSVSRNFQTGTHTINDDAVCNHADHIGKRHWFRPATWEMIWLQLCNHHFLQVPRKIRSRVKVFVQQHSSLDCQVVIMLNPEPCWVYLEMPSIVTQFIGQKWSVTVLQHCSKYQGENKQTSEWNNTVYGCSNDSGTK